MVEVVLDDAIAEYLFGQVLSVKERICAVEVEVV